MSGKGDEKAQMFVLQTGYEYEDNEVLGVFSTRTRALIAITEYTKEVASGVNTHFRIHTLTLDELEVD